LVERRLAKAKVAGSRPVSRSKKSKTYDLRDYPTKPIENPRSRPSKPVTLTAPIRPQTHLSRVIAERYWPVARASLSPTSQNRDGYILETLIAELGNPRLCDMRPDLLEAWWAQCIEVRTPGTANEYAVRLKHLCHKLATWGYLADNPARFIAKVREPQGRVKWLTPEQRARLLAHANPRLRVYILAARYTGARRGNLVALRVKDVDRERNLITFPMTKNGAGHRVPLLPELKRALLGAGISSDPDAPLLPPMTLDAVSRAFKRLVQRLGLGDYRFHDLRHDCASSLAMGGANQAVIMAMLGHRDPRMSARYTHLADDTVRGAMLKGLT
jgi:integrase